MNIVPWAKNKGLVSVHFNSITELCDYDIRQVPGIHDNCVNKFNALVGHAPGETGRHDWLGPTNGDAHDVITHAMIGDPDLYKMVKNMSVEIDKATGKSTDTYTETVRRQKRKLQFGKFGDELDIHKIYQGHADTAWARRVRHPLIEAVNLITLYVDIGGNSNMLVTESLWRAAAAIKLADDYESAGKSVRIIVGSTAMRALSGSDALISQSINVKSYNERLPLERLAAMCHLGFHRVFGFAARHCQPTMVNSNYGYSVPIKAGVIPIHLQEEIDAGHTKIIIVPLCTSLDEAICTIKEVYASIKNQQ